MQSNPECKAILLCERSSVLEHSGRITARGIFNTLPLPIFPGHTPPFTVFVQLVDGVGRYQIVVEIHDLREDRVIASTPEIRLEFPDRLASLTVLIPILPLPVEHPGRYDVLVLANGQEIDRQQFIAISEDDDEEEDFEEGPNTAPDLSDN